MRNNISRGCPNCMGSMDFRLGEFVCPNCGHNEPATAPEEEISSSGPGFRSEKKWDDGSKKQVHEEKVSRRPTEGSLYSLGADSQIGKEKPVERKLNDNLQIEKHVFYSVSVLIGIVKVFGIGAQISPADTTFQPWSNIGIAVWLLALAYALYGSDSLTKQGCMGWSVISIVATVASLFYSSTLLSEFSAPGLAGGASLTGAMITVAVFLGVIWQLWLIWILYRDAQRVS